MPIYELLECSTLCIYLISYCFIMGIYSTPKTKTVHENKARPTDPVHFKIAVDSTTFVLLLGQL